MNFVVCVYIFFLNEQKKRFRCVTHSNEKKIGYFRFIYFFFVLKNVLLYLGFFIIFSFFEHDDDAFEEFRE
jgi:hypothetical protein